MSLQRRPMHTENCDALSLQFLPKYLVYFNVIRFYLFKIQRPFVTDHVLNTSQSSLHVVFYRYGIIIFCRFLFFVFVLFFYVGQKGKLMNKGVKGEPIHIESNFKITAYRVHTQVILQTFGSVLLCFAAM